MDQHHRARAEFRARLPDALAALMPEHPHGPAEDYLVVGTGRVTREQLLGVLRQQAALEETPPLAGPREGRSCGLVASAWRRVVYRQVRAVLVLFDSGLAVQAQPNARSALEHAVMLQALADAQAAGNGDDFLRAVDALHRQRNKDSLKRLGQMDGEAADEHADLLQTAAGWLDQSSEAAKRERASRRPPSAGPRPDVGKVRAVFDGLAGGEKHFYDIFARLSEGAHAGLGSALPYLRSRELGLVPVPVEWARTLAALSWACWAADDAMDEFLIAPELAARHEPLTSPLGFVPGTSKRAGVRPDPEGA